MIKTYDFPIETLKLMASHIYVKLPGWVVIIVT